MNQKNERPAPPHAEFTVQDTKPPVESQPIKPRTSHIGW